MDVSLPYGFTTGIATSDSFYLAKFVNLSLNALALILALSANPMIEGVEDADHPMKWDGREELVQKNLTIFLIGVHLNFESCRF
jgi:hypothetical protein